MIRDLIKNFIAGTAGQFAKDIAGPNFELPEISVEKSANPIFGDYSSNVCFVLAKKLGRKADELAGLMAIELNEAKPNEIYKIEIAGNGYLNFFLDRHFVQEQLPVIYRERECWGSSKIGKGKKIVIDYSAPNIAKPMHVGHTRSTIIGDALANIYDYLGYKTIRWNYFGDWGTQFGKLIAAYKLWGDKRSVEKDPINELVKLYVRFHEELKTNPELNNRGQEEFKKLEQGDKENRKLWEWFKKESLKNFKKVYEMLGVKFDVESGESEYEDELAPTIEDLLKRGIAERGEGGSLIVKLDKYNLPPALVQKSDGATLYLTRDIAALKSRIKKYSPEKLLYVVANQQTLHFQQLFAIAEMLGLIPESAKADSGSPDHFAKQNGLGLSSAKLEHVKFGMVLGADNKKLATREGNVVTFDELAQKAIAFARKIVEEKNPDLLGKEKEEIAQAVAIGALKYQDLKEHRNSDIVFDWDRMLDFNGNSAPYIQYTYARLLNIKNKVGAAGRADFHSLDKDIELQIIKHLFEFQNVLIQSSETNLTNILALYLFELANLANKFYETSHVAKEPSEFCRNARLTLVETTAEILKIGLGLLGIKVLKKI